MRHVLTAAMGLVTLALTFVLAATILAPRLVPSAIIDQTAGEGPVAAARPQGDSGTPAVIGAAGGESKEATNVELTREELNLTSVTREHAEFFTYMLGKARVTIPLNEVRRIEMDGDKVRVTGLDDCVLEGMADADAGYAVSGFHGNARFEAGLMSLRSVEFPSHAHSWRHCPLCSTDYRDPDWLYCPKDRTELVEKGE